MKPATLLAAGSLLLLGPPCAAQDYRDGLMLPAPQLYERMLGYARDKDFAKVERSLQAVKPVLDALKARHGPDLEVEIRDSIDKNDADSVLRGIRRLVVLDMKDQMRLARENAGASKERAATRFRGAYLDYLLVSGTVQDRNFTADQRIKNAFRRGVLVGSAEGLGSAADEIERELAAALPEIGPGVKR